MHSIAPEALPGYAHRHETWNEITAVSSIGRRTMGAVPNYRLLRAATQIDATAGSRLLLVHLIGYLGPDDESRPDQRFVVFPGNTRLSDELRCTKRTIQRQADELEDKGFLRRCYNQLNQRSGFDLTPFAMQHEQVIAAVVAIHTQRRQEREAAQLELSLEVDRISRPNRSAATSMSPRGDAGVTRNRTENIKDDVGTAASDALDAFDWRKAASAAFGDSVQDDRTWDQPDAILAHISSAFTGGGRLSHLGWASALQTLGRNRAVALYLVALRDPRRRQSAERYFGWLLRMAAEGTHEVIVAAAGRASASLEKTAAPGSIARLASAIVPAAALGIKTTDAAGNAGRAVKGPVLVEQAMRAPDAQVAVGAEELPAAENPRAAASDAAGKDDRGLHEAIRVALGNHLYQAWIARARCQREGRDVVVTAPSAFAAGWIERNLADTIAKAAGSRPGREVGVRIRTMS